MDVLSKWRVKPYIDVTCPALWEKCATTSADEEFLDYLQDGRHSSFWWEVKAIGKRIDLSNGLFDFRLTPELFHEIMYQVEEAPPMVLEPKPFWHGKIIRVRSDLPPDDQRRMNYYAGIWEVEFIEMQEGRYGEAMNLYQLSMVGSRNTGCCLQRFMVEEYFEVIE